MIAVIKVRRKLCSLWRWEFLESQQWNNAKLGIMLSNRLVPSMADNEYMDYGLLTGLNLTTHYEPSNKGNKAINEIPG